MSLYESFDFLKEVSGLLKLHFPLKDYIIGGYFWLSSGEHFLPAFLPVSFFLGQGEKYTGKNLAETQPVVIQVKSGETPVCKSVEKMKQNVDSLRLTPKLAKMTCYPIPKI